jgi:hypothetical protein
MAARQLMGLPLQAVAAHCLTQSLGCFWVEAGAAGGLEVGGPAIASDTAAPASSANPQEVARVLVLGGPFIGVYSRRSLGQ